MTNEMLDICKEKTKGIFHITEYRRFWNYITNLQEENERLDKNNKQMQVEMLISWGKHDELQARINKAIELIDEPIYYCTDKMETPKIFINRLKEVKNTLQGEDNE